MTWKESFVGTITLATLVGGLFCATNRGCNYIQTAARQAGIIAPYETAKIGGRDYLILHSGEDVAAVVLGTKEKTSKLDPDAVILASGTRREDPIYGILRRAIVESNKRDENRVIVPLSPPQRGNELRELYQQDPYYAGRNNDLRGRGWPPN